MPDNFQFAYPLVVLLLPLPLLVYWLLPAIKNKSSALRYPYFKRAVAVTAQKPKTASYVKKRGIIPWVVMYSIWALLLVALASPELVGKPEKKIKTSRNFLIAADISFSMANTDWTIDGKRASRWDAVKDIMKDFVKERKSDRLGLLFFGSNAYVQAPFTSDLNTVSTMLDEADVGMAGQMTNIGKAIVKGMDLFQRDTIPHKVMLILTDGVDSGMEILPLDAANLAKKDSTVIYTIGIGDPDNSDSDLDERTLQDISEMTNGAYFRAKDAKALQEIYKTLDTLEPIEYEEESYTPKTLLYYIPLGFALALGIIAMAINNLILIVKRFKNR
ncbi:vWA domain-containing protein [Formosa algae]|uniref:Ca-activated chloride channel family protein n=1 Tax=Formosa algae TaxID=225843 RepID=A0A9X0YKF0_9FLAO|nr:VWA domain-containing protein [Formosa algae]MBP1838829.1 Ca-activated chloride channel family protein [Formosa algae]MDQ0333606.1 Ca-activated chloride channel family protein [Formosa algae]OEI80259.1 magnesium chelatase [Formosa algae]